MKKLIGIVLIAGMLCGSSYGYGGRGHRLVGAIADKRLTNTRAEAVRKKLNKLLDGLTLEEVATLPDSIKDWDPKKENASNPSTPREPFHVVGHPQIEAQLRAFVNANPAEGKPSHHEFHYTDVPVLGLEKYGDGQVGRSEFDIVHMIPFCIRVLKGQIPEKNKRAITKTVAVILLAHYFGDIHQPLHVGAEYFNASGKALQPTPGKPGFADAGGNKLTLSLLVKGKLTMFLSSQGKAGNLHGYWDSQAVTNALGATPDDQTADELARSEPANWKLNSPVENWAELLANEIMPIAREAHNRLEFKNIKIEAASSEILSGDASEKKKSGALPYEKWASDTVKNEIHKAGWRLAALLAEVLK